ncbi:MAG TPA: hypothetical protein VGM06_02485 [Polyangiaceae bacterium]|jgi:hypothetical protein
MRRALGPLAACFLAVACILNPQPHPPDNEGASGPGGGKIIISNDASTAFDAAAAVDGSTSGSSDAGEAPIGVSGDGAHATDGAFDGPSAPASDAEAGPGDDAAQTTDTDGSSDDEAPHVVPD